MFTVNVALRWPPGTMMLFGTVATSSLLLASVTNALPVQVLGPFRQEDRLPALGTIIDQSGLNVLSGARGSELHDASSALLPLPARAHRIATAPPLKQEH